MLGCSTTNVVGADLSVWSDIIGKPCKQYRAEALCDNLVYNREYRDLAGNTANSQCCECIVDPFNPLDSRFPSSDCDEGIIISMAQWKDTGGYTCRDYAKNKWCSAERIVGENWNSDRWGDITDTTDVEGFSALEHCCECMDSSSTYFKKKCLESGYREATIDDEYNENSIIYDWKDKNGFGCRVYTALDKCASGEFSSVEWKELMDSSGVHATDVCCGCMDPKTLVYTQYCNKGDDGIRSVWMDSERRTCQDYEALDLCQGRFILCA